MATPFGRRLLPSLVDEIARDRPTLTYAHVPLTAQISDGFKPVTFSDMATAVNHVAGWINSTLGPSSSFETLAYMGSGDLRYAVVFLGAVKCGYKVLLPSLRNSAWMNASLLQQTKCRHLIYAPEVEALVQPLVQERGDLKVHKMQSFEELLVPGTTHYPFQKEYDAAKWDPILVLHSSGSTGAPKPIVMNHATFAVGDHDRNLPKVPGRENQNWALWDFPQEETFLSSFPAFHLVGFSTMVIVPIYYTNASLVLTPAARPPTGHMVSEIMDHFPLKAIFCPPIVAEQLAQCPGALEKCAKLKFLLYAGGPLSQAAGDALSTVTDVCQFYGQTETGLIQALVPRREDWASLEWHPLVGAFMEPSVDDTFEMIMKRNPALESVRGVSCNFPEVEVWRTRDLFKAHPTKPGLWTFHGRADDIMVLSNGEKFNPVPSETRIAAHPLVSGALIIGQGFPQPALVLEPKDGEMPQHDETLVAAVWPTVELANKDAPGHARITKDMIIVAKSTKPFDRAAKMTVIRGSTSKKYEEEVARLHSENGGSRTRHAVSPLGHTPDRTACDAFVRQVVAVVFAGRKVQDMDDLFVLGLDSLQTTEMVSLLRQGVKAANAGSPAWVNMRFVYQNPSIEALGQAIFDALHNVPKAHIDDNDNVNDDARVRQMRDLLTKYTANLPTAHPQGKPPRQQPQRHHVVLTGSTGSLGIQILAVLLADPSIEHVTCLDRSREARDRVTQAFTIWSAPSEVPALDPARVTFHQCDLAQPDLGLGPNVLSDLRQRASILIHNAWTVDFNQSLASFAPVHVAGVRHLVDLAAESLLNPCIVFVSSISAAAASTSDIPESLPAVGLAAALPMGYAESKAVAEHMLVSAASKSGVRVAVLRVGQVAGPADPGNGGMWSAREWFPLLARASAGLRIVPAGDALGDVDWVPVDVLAKVVWEIVRAVEAAHEDGEGARFFNVVNPASRPWAELLPVVKARLGDVQEVSMKEWVANLERVGAENREAGSAMKIMDFFRTLAEDVGGNYLGSGEKVSVLVHEACRASASLRTLGPVSEEWLGRWMESWGLQGHCMQDRL